MSLVFLPGMMCDARLFGPQLAVFNHATTIVAKTGDTIQAMAEDVLANAPSRFALAGLSMGGIVAMEVIRLAPDRVTKLALMDTNYKAETCTVKAGRFPQIEAANSGRLSDVMRDEMKPRYLVDSPAKAEILDLCMDMANDLGADVFVRQSHALMHRPDQQETVEGITCPTLVLCGAQDRLCPISNHEAMSSLIPNSTLTIIQGAGHLPTLEKPNETNTALSHWLEV